MARPRLTQGLVALNAAASAARASYLHPSLSRAHRPGREYSVAGMTLPRESVMFLSRAKASSAPGACRRAAHSQRVAKG